MLDATDRNEVLSWSERQLGSQAGLVSVLQMDQQPSSDSVEKSGTGIEPAKTEGCTARLSFMADSVQRVAGLDREITQSFEWYRLAELRGRKTSVH